MKHRVFVAIDFPPNVRAQAEDLQRQLERLKLPIRWEPVQKIHLTLAFMGRLTEGDLGQVYKRVGNISSRYPAGYLQPVAVEALYQRHEPSLIYLLLADKEGRIRELQAQLAEALDEVTPQPRRKFLLHATIGRVRKSDPTSVKQALDKLAEVEMTPMPEFAVEQIHVYESFLSKSGSRYQRLASFNLGKRE